MSKFATNPHLKDVLEVFLQPLLDAYGEPTKTENLEGFLYEYANLLKGYLKSELEDGKTRVLATHKGPHRWPRIPECIAACEDAKAARRTRMAAGANIERLAALTAPKTYTQQELLEAQIFVDRVAAGKIRITAPESLPGSFQRLMRPEDVERANKAFQSMARAMIARRGRDVA